MRKSWDVRPLGEIASVGAGSPAPQDKAAFAGGDLPFFRTSDVGQIRFGRISTSADKLNKKAASKLRPVPAGTILLPKSGASTFLNHRVLTEANGYASSHLATVSAVEGVTIPEYLLYFLSTVRAQDLIQDHKYPSLQLSIINQISVPLPPIEEQKRIAAVLDEAFKGLARARENAETNLAGISALFDEVVATAFATGGDQSDTCKLGEVAEFRNGLNFTRGSNGEEVKIVGVGDFKDNFLVPESRLSTARIDGALDEADLLKAGDLLAVRSNGNRMLIGRVMLANEMSSAVSFSGFTIRIRLKSDRVLPEYLCHYMKTPKARERLVSGGSGANISNLNQRILGEFPVMLPSIVRQRAICRQIAEAIETRSDVRARYEATVSDMDALRQSLLHKAFSGQLT